MRFWKAWRESSESRSPLLDTDDEKHFQPKRETRLFSLRWIYALPTLVLAIAMVVVATYFWVSQPTISYTHARPNVQSNLIKSLTLDCGSTNEEAVSRGCVMEPMLYGWVPPACYFSNLSMQYEVFSDREWYSDSDFGAASKVPIEDIWAGKHQHLYVHRYHTEHCLFLWRKLAWAIKEKSPWLDTKTLTVSHTDHCSKQLARQCEQEDAINNVQLGFYECVRLPWD